MSDTDTNSLDSFEYTESLTHSDSELARIRLFHLLHSDHLQDDIQIELREYPLDESCPDYETLSYVWGDPTDRVRIRCNSLALDITSNLSYALRHLRLLTNHPFWVDQICINQHDQLEKSSQVGLMRDIYQRSVRTLAWLGPEDEALSTTFTCFDRFSNAFGEKVLAGHYHEYLEALSKDGLADILASSRDPEKFFGAQPPTAAETRMISRALCNPWFTRMWIVQEAAVSPELELVAGSSTLSFDAFALGLVVHQSMNAEGRENNRINAGHKNMQNFFYIRSTHQKRQEAVRHRQLALPNLLAHCYGFKASDPRDRFYALYGLTTTNLISASLLVDYVSPPTQAMCATVINILRQDESLRLLELAECKGDPSLPSWVPGPRSPADPALLPLSKLIDIDNSGVLHIVASLFKLHGKLLGEKFTEADIETIHNAILAEHQDLRDRASKLDAKSTTPLEYLDLLDHTTLCLKGQLLDRIEQVAPVVLLPAAMNRGYGCFDREAVDLSTEIDNAADCGDSLGEVAKAVGSTFSVTMKFVGGVIDDWKLYNDANVRMDAMVTNRKTSAYSSHKDLITAYRNTVCGGQWNLAADGERYPSVLSSLMGDMSDEESVKAFEAWRSTIAGGVRINNLKSKIGLNGGAGLGSLLSTSISAHSKHSLRTKLMTGTAMSCLLGRRLAWTVHGRLALVPAITEPGDLIFCLRGGDMPFVLRPTGDAFRFLGPTYLDGYMNGELANVEAHGIVKLV